MDYPACSSPAHLPAPAPASQEDAREHGGQERVRRDPQGDAQHAEIGGGERERDGELRAVLARAALSSAAGATLLTLGYGAHGLRYAVYDLEWLARAEGDVAQLAASLALAAADLGVLSVALRVAPYSLLPAVLTSVFL